MGNDCIHFRQIHDMDIEDTIGADNGYRGKELRILNQIRQSIHAFTLSDIVTADGKQITIQAWQASGSNGLRRDKEWP
jgi:hypothetical protein